MKAADLLTKMEDLKNVIRNADNMVRENKAVNLSGLDAKVSYICNKVTGLSAAEAADLQPLMADLIGELEHLSTSLQDYRDNLKKR